MEPLRPCLNFARETDDGLPMTKVEARERQLLTHQAAAVRDWLKGEENEVTLGCPTFLSDEERVGETGLVTPRALEAGCQGV